jgi:hypothetical protein
MAGTPLVGSKQTIYDLDVDFNSTNSEAINTKIAKAALFSQDVTEYPVSFNYAGYFTATVDSLGAERFIVTKRSTINRYILSIGSTGASTANALNVKVYDEDGNFVNDLFTSTFEPSILTASNIDNAYIGRDEVANTNLNSTNVSAETLNYGTINLTTLEEGYQLIGEVITRGSGGKHADLTLILQRLE